MHLFLIRHGQSEGNASGVVQGKLDFPLSPLGEEQARATAACLADVPFDRIISSPLLRAYQTAAAVAAPHDMEVEVGPGLSEYDVGEVSGLTGPEIRERFPHVLDAYRRGERPAFPGEEGRDIFEARVLGAIDHLREVTGTSALVTHGGVISMLCSLAVGIDQRYRPGIFQVANCSITELATDRQGRLVIERHNDTCHLREIVTRADRG